MAYEYFIHLAILIGIYCILAISLNLAVGFTGLLNLGHVAFFGIGAYASALLSINLGIDIWLAMILAGVIASLFGIILAIPTARLKGDYLALAALGFAFIASAFARNWTSLTRGALGIPGIPKGFSDNLYYLIFVIAMTVLVYAVTKAITITNLGKTFQAIRDDETAARILGKNTFAYKTISLSISAFFAGIAGSLYAHYITFIDPSVFSIAEIILLFSILIVGGLASLPGSVLGAVILLLIPEPLRFIGFPSSIIGPAREMIFALILLIIIIYRPKGMLGKVDLSGE